MQTFSAASEHPQVRFTVPAHAVLVAAVDSFGAASGLVCRVAQGAQREGT